MKRINVSDEEISAVTEQLYERRLQEMFTWIENYDVQETRRATREEERISIARRLLVIGLSIESIVLATGLTQEEVEGLLNDN